MGISSALGSSALLPAGLGFRNVVYNGNFDIWQRGTSFSTDNAATAIYTADRWCARALYPNSSAVQTISQESTHVPTGSRYSLKSVVATAAVVNNSRMQLCYTAEPLDSIRYAGRQMILTLQAKAIQNIDRIAVTTVYNTSGGKSFDGTTISSTTFTINTSSFTTCTVPFVLPSAATLTTSGTIGFVISYTRSSGSAEQVGDGIYLSQVQLEQNYQPTPFEQRPISVELMMCQRYYTEMNPHGSSEARFGNGPIIGSGAGYVYVPLPVSMRTNPSSVAWSGTFQLSDDYAAGAGVSTIVMLSNRQSATSIGLSILTSTSPLTVGRTGYLSATATNARLAFSAEL